MHPEAKVFAIVTLVSGVCSRAMRGVLLEPAAVQVFLPGSISVHESARQGKRDDGRY